MTATPTNGFSCFPFAVNCRLTKKFFGFPRKCDNCYRLIVWTAGFSCQFCSFHCHRRCSEKGNHTKSCSLSRLTSGDNQLFEKLLRETDADKFPDDWASLLADTSTQMIPSPETTTNDNLKTLISTEPRITEEEEMGEKRVNKSPIRTVVQQTPFVNRIFRLLAWPTRVQFSKIDLASKKSVFPSRTPVDDFNEDVLEELLINSQKRLTENVRMRQKWERQMARGRGAHSQECILDQDDRSTMNTSENSSISYSKLMFFRSTWPICRMHINHYEDDYLHSDSSISDRMSPFPERHSWTTTMREYSTNESNVDLGEWAIPWTDLQFDDCMLDGADVRMFHGRWHGEVMLHEYEEGQLDRFRTDVKTLAKIRHENIALFMGASIELPRMVIVSSIRKGDSLYETVHIKQRRMTQQTKVAIAKQIAQGMGYLHAKRIVLQCLTSRNVYLECKVKICTLDYGRPPRFRMDPGYSVIALFPGQLTYIAPELMSTIYLDPPRFRINGQSTNQSDVFAYGTVLFEMLAGRFPFADQSAQSVIWRVGSGQRQDLLGLDCQTMLRTLLADCWTTDGACRPSFTTILKQLHQTVSLQKKNSSSVPEQINRTCQAQQPFRKLPYQLPYFPI